MKKAQATTQEPKMKTKSATRNLSKEVRAAAAQAEARVAWEDEMSAFRESGGAVCAVRACKAPATRPAWNCDASSARCDGHVHLCAEASTRTSPPHVPAK